jgi:predicted dehydrogenase
MERVKLAVVGVGNLGSRHARIASEVEGVDLVFVVDINRERAYDVAGKYSATPAFDHREVLEEVDAAVIATPTSSHFEIARDFLSRGRHVLIEKPITDNPDQAAELIKIAEKNNLVLHIGHVERYNPAIEKLYEIKEKPIFLRAQRMSEFPGRSTDIDVVFDLMIHDIDIIIGLMKERPRVENAFGISFVTDKIDFAIARLRFNGCLAEIAASRVYDRKLRRLDVFYKESFYIKVDYASMSLEKFYPKENRIESQTIQTLNYEPLKKEMEYFVKAVSRSERSIDYGGYEALVLAHEISRLAEESARDFLRG